MRNLIGEVFGRLIVVGPCEIRRIGKSRQEKSHWFCRCSCDAKTEKFISGDHLVNGRTKSCGCVGKEIVVARNIGRKGLPNYGNRKAPGIAARNDLLGRYKAAAKRRKYEWSLTEEQFDIIVKSNCFYCGVSPDREIKRAGGSFFYNGIDRLENEPYYRSYNSVPCCWDCNSRKRAWGSKRFIAWAMRIAEHQKMACITSSLGVNDERDREDR